MLICSSSLLRVAGRSGGSTVVAQQVWQRAHLSTQEPVQVEMLDQQKGIAELRMQKPPVNSLDRSMLAGIADAVKALEKDGARAALVTSAVPGIFSAGLNLLDLYSQRPEQLVEFWGHVQQMFLTLHPSRLLTVACVAGAAPAGGCLIATSCDYRIMLDAPKTVIGLNETLVGIPVPHWMRMNFCDVVGKRQTDLALQMGTLFPAQAALKVGLVDETADSADAVRQRALQRLQQWLKVPDAGRVFSKQIHTEAIVQYLTTRRREDAEMFAKVVSQDAIQKVLGKYIAGLQAKSKAK